VNLHIHVVFQFFLQLTMAIVLPSSISFPVLFFLSEIIIPIQNLIVWGPNFVMDFYTSSEITAEKLSAGVIGLGLFMLFLGYKKKISLQG